MSHNNGVPKHKLDDYDEPVLYAGPGSSIWHVPQVKDEKAVFLCSRSRKQCRVTDLSAFRRRRDVRQCKHCQEAQSEDKTLLAGGTT